MRRKVKVEERKGVIGKECTKCGEWKSLEDFKKKTGGVGDKDPKCRECFAVHRDSKKEKIRYNRWAQRNPEKLKKMRQDSFRKWYQNNKEQEAERKRQWERNNPEKAMRRILRRKEREALLPNTLTINQTVKIMNAFKGCCALTGESDSITLDHVIPVSIGHGGTTDKNIIPMTARLNESKRDLNIFEWFESNKLHFVLSQKRFDNLIAWLASANAMTVEEYRNYVYWCHANPRDI